MCIAIKIIGLGVLFISVNLWSADIDIYNQDSVLAAASLPLTVHNQAVNENQVYIGMFRPDRDAPFWEGNLKLYQIGLDATSTEVVLLDAEGRPVVDSASGLVNSQARSFWTSGNNSPDGAAVSLGGVAQGLRDYLGKSRVNLTCTGPCNVLEPFAASNTNLLPGDFGAQDAAQMHSIINWASDIGVQPFHGDVIHSRPEAINYGGSLGTYVFYGSNDGMFHGVKGGLIEKSTLISSKDGEEAWAFTAPEQFQQLANLFYREAAYSTDKRSESPFANKPYFFDGSATSYLRYNSNHQIGNDSAGESSQAIIYLTARRGGNLIYALDVTNPVSPKILWHKSAVDSGFTELGQTWSTPKIAQLNIKSSGIEREVPALLMGLGYDPVAEDEVSDGRSDSAVRTQGRGLIILNALSGDIIWQLTSTHSAMDYAVPASLTVIDQDGNGSADLVYFGDTGGQLWTLDLQSTDLADWQAKRLITLPKGRKFLNAPDAVTSPDGSYNAVIIGSGDSEKPFDTSIQNYLLFYRDSKVSPSQSLMLEDLYQITIDPVSMQFDEVQREKNTTVKNGWYLQLEPGEKVVTRALTANNITTFATHIPCTADDCNGLGEARIYRFDPFNLKGKGDKERAYRRVEHGGILPPPTKFTLVIEDENCEADNCVPEKKIISGALFGPHIEQFGDQGLGDRRKLWRYNHQDD
ncbi:PilC/PilY family type IV pilus protein [Porticoccaceae bacterium]|nr:PilC/PilY family type IV pilus protein [Porticoccaceae bacterium]